MLSYQSRDSGHKDEAVWRHSYLNEANSYIQKEDIFFIETGPSVRLMSYLCLCSLISGYVVILHRVTSITYIVVACLGSCCTSTANGNKYKFAVVFLSFKLGNSVVLAGYWAWTFEYPMSELWHSTLQIRKWNYSYYAGVLTTCLTHWGRVTHICVGNLTIIDPDNGLSPGRRQAIIWTNAWILLIGPLGTNSSEILVGIQTFSFKKMHFKMSSPKWRPFCLGLNVLTHWEQNGHNKKSYFRHWIFEYSNVPCLIFCGLHTYVWHNYWTDICTIVWEWLSLGNSGLCVMSSSFRHLLPGIHKTTELP